MKKVIFLFLFYATYIKSQILPGISNTEEYFPKIKNKNIGIVCNHTSIINNKHIIDTFISAGIKVKKIFTPEHGLFGREDAGQKVSNSIYKNIPIISLYGKKKKPTKADLSDIDVIIFDIQDVGVRFYTYISTLHYVMESCAEYGVPLIVLDRPNPLSFYIDGPVLDTSCCRSFVGMHPIPVVYGLTIGELALMINNEGWLRNNLKCSLEIIKCKNYKHSDRYQLPIKPSPNLIDMKSVYLYPSICLFEGTSISVGRGTDYPFQFIGHPLLKDIYKFYFIPKPKQGAIKPLYEGKKCFGLDLRNANDSTFTLKYLIELYKNFPDKDNFFNSYFDKLIGNKEIKNLIKENILNEDSIRKTWEKDLIYYKTIRKKYLLYDD
ncbi:MAG: DUF1343 domain-containing protein [Bacteroidales bacterium]|nr:DUF1343 domain-containing protein [Bacteroidales bacterium]